MSNRSNSRAGKLRVWLVCLGAIGPAGSAAVGDTLVYDSDAGTAGAQDGTTALWQANVGNWYNQTTLADNVVWTDGNAAVFGAGNGGTAGTITLSGTVAPTAITFEPPASGNYLISGGTIGFLNSSSPTITTNTDATIKALLGGTGLTIAKAGTGTLTLQPGTTTTNSYTGAINVNAGTLALGSGFGGDGAIRGNVNIASGAIVRLTSQGNIIVNSATFNIASTGTFNLNGQSDVIGYLAGAGSVTNNNATLTLDLGGTSQTFSGSIAGTGGLTVRAAVGTAAQVLSGTSGYTGATAVQNGTLSINSIGDVGTGATALGNPANATAATVALGNLTTTGTLQYTGPAVSTNRPINLAGTTGGGMIDASGTGPITFTANVTAGTAGAKAFTLTGNNVAANTIQGVISNSSGGATTVGKSGVGTWVLSGNNTFTGGVTVGAGTLRVGNAGAFNATTPNSLSMTGGTVQLNGNSLTLGDGTGTAGLSGTGGIIENASATPATLTVNQSSANRSQFLGTLRDGAGGGAMSLVKTGTGVLQLSGTQSYTGTTVVKQGTLILGTAAPTQISGTSLKVWLDGSDASTLFKDTAGTTPAAASADSVALWKDKSGAGNNFSNSTAANQPTLQTGVQNGSSVIRFDGSNDQLLSAANVGALSIFIVNNPSSGQKVLAGIVGLNGADKGIRRNGDTAWQSPGDGNDFTNPANSVMRVNGVTTNAAPSGTWHYLTAIRGTTAQNINSLGSYFGGREFKGDIAEVLVYNSILSATDRSAVESYLQAKWFGGGAGGGIASTAATTVQNGGTIAGNGSISGPLTIESGGTISPGDAVGSIAAAGLTLQSGSSTVLDITGTGTAGITFDQLRGTAGTTTPGGNLTVNLGYTPTAVGETYTIIADSAGVTLAAGTFDTLNGQPLVGNAATISGVTYQLQYGVDADGAGGANDVVLTVAVPEPASAGLIAVGAAGLLLRRRRVRA